MYTLEITASAEAELDGITEYIGVKLCNPPAAISFLDALDAVAEMLENSPFAFPLCADSRLADMGYRKATIKSYILVFEIDEVAHVVRALRFFHETEDYAHKI